MHVARPRELRRSAGVAIPPTLCEALLRSLVELDWPAVAMRKKVSADGYIVLRSSDDSGTYSVEHSWAMSQCRMIQLSQPRCFLIHFVTPRYSGTGSYQDLTQLCASLMACERMISISHPFLIHFSSIFPPLFLNLAPFSLHFSSILLRFPFRGRSPISILCNCSHP